MAEETICLVPEGSEGLEELGICGPIYLLDDLGNNLIDDSGNNLKR